MKILINIPLIGLLISYLVFLIQWWPRFQCIKRNRAKIICRYSTWFFNFDFAKESLEVVIVLAIILQFLTKMKQDGLLEESLYYKFRREVAGFHEGFHGIRFHGRARMKGSFFLGGTFQVGGAMISYLILYDYI